MTDAARIALARSLVERAHADPVTTLAAAEALVAQARDAADFESAAVAARAAALSGMQLDELATAVAHLRRAVRWATRSGAVAVRGESRVSLAGALVRSGSVSAGFEQIALALDDLDDLGRARAIAQRAAMHIELGHADQALADCRAALPVLRRAADLVWVQRTVLNRGVLHTLQHRYQAAARDLAEAGELGEALGRRMSVALTHENLAFVHQRLGDVPTALRHGDLAAEIYTDVGSPIGSLLMDRSELLLSVHMFSEARKAAADAIAEFDRTDRRVTRPEARLVLARAAMLERDYDTAYGQVVTAAREFRAQGRHSFVALARYARLNICCDDPDRPTPPFAALVEVADALDGVGWRKAALDARMLAGRTWLHSPRVAGRAREQLGQVARSRGRGPAAGRVLGWHAAALLREHAGDQAGSSAASLAGLRVLAEYRALMAATDLRARVSALGQDLAQIGLRHALQRASVSAPRHRAGRAFDVLEWAERGRAQHLLQRPVRIEDDELATLLADLRDASSRLDEAEAVGRPTERLVARVAHHERLIRDYTRRQQGEEAAQTETLPTRSELVDLLGAAILVEYVESDGRLYAVTVGDRHTTVTALGAVTEIEQAVRWLPFALSRLARPTGLPGRAQAAANMLAHTAATLDDLLVRPLPPGVHRPTLAHDGPPVVIAPTGVLQSLPWSILPSFSGRPVTVTPSAALWSATMQRRATPGPVLVAAGPGLPGANLEASQVAALHGTRALLGPDAKVEAVMSGMRGASIAHLAAHGTVRADNPLFSSLRLHDGPLTAYDLERLDHDADTVVLAACESGRSVVLAGDELLGLGAAMLSGDTRHLVASVVPVPDAATAPLMLELHRRLLSGDTVAGALARAQANVDASDPAALAAAAGFICLGAGHDIPAQTVTLDVSGR